MHHGSKKLDYLMLTRLERVMKYFLKSLDLTSSSRLCLNEEHSKSLLTSPGVVENKACNTVLFLKGQREPQGNE